MHKVMCKALIMLMPPEYALNTDSQQKRIKFYKADNHSEFPTYISSQNHKLRQQKYILLK